MKNVHRFTFDMEKRGCVRVVTVRPRSLARHTHAIASFTDTMGDSAPPLPDYMRRYVVGSWRASSIASRAIDARCNRNIHEFVRRFDLIARVKRKVNAPVIMKYNPKPV